MNTDTSERGLESLICKALTGQPCEPGVSGVAQAAVAYGGAGWVCGSARDYDREYCLDVVQLRAFLDATQPGKAEALQLREEGPTRTKFLARLRTQISKRGSVDVLRHGIKHGAHELRLFYGTPSQGNLEDKRQFMENRFSVTRQLRYSRNEAQLALDLGLFINGLPVATFELKNSLTKQTVHDAITQYQKDRNPREELFRRGRCMAHFALDEQEVHFCTHLAGKRSRFLPFNKGWKSGAGNPPNPQGLKTSYLWKDILGRKSLSNILENYAQLMPAQDTASGNSGGEVQIWPRYHQLEVVRKLLKDVAKHGAGKRYLIQHSAGSGKSNSIAWLAHQLIPLEKNDSAPLFESIIVVTDRRILDKQICNTIKQYAQVSAAIGHAEHSGDLRKFIESGKKIIISTVQKFPFIIDAIGDMHRGRNFAIVIDEAHSSQGGKGSAAISGALSQSGQQKEDESFEDTINRLMQSRKMLPNASYFAFTATPKNKTLEIFGTPDTQSSNQKFRPFHSYTMKQAIQEEFILDVLAHYVPVAVHRHLAKSVEEDPRFDSKRALKKLKRYVDEHNHSIRIKTELMVDHFHKHVQLKMGRKARAMVVSHSVQSAIKYFHAFNRYLQDIDSPYRAIVAFSGEREFEGKTVSEAKLNEFPSREIADRIKGDPYRFLICADKFQTGYDEPLLHTMYVDKPLAGIKAVQTLSRLNRAYPGKSDVFVLDFVNDTKVIEHAFADYYRTTILAEASDPNRLHDLKADLDSHQIYTEEQIEEFVRLFLGGAERDQLDPILDACVALYKKNLRENEQVEFKGKTKAFVRAYNFLSSILPYNNISWEKLSIFLYFLVWKLPAPVEEDLTKGILKTIDMDSYRAEKQARHKMLLADEDAEIDPVPTDGAGGQRDPELDPLSDIVREFNERFGSEPWDDKDRVRTLITKDIPERVSTDEAYRTAREHSDEQNARIEHDNALRRVMQSFMRDNTELFKQFADNEDFKSFLTRTSFRLTYHDQPEAPSS